MSKSLNELLAAARFRIAGEDQTKSADHFAGKNKSVDVTNSLGKEAGVDLKPSTEAQQKFAEFHKINKSEYPYGNDHVFTGERVKYSLETRQNERLGNTEKEAINGAFPYVPIPEEEEDDNYHNARLEVLKSRAQKISKDEGVVQHVNKHPQGNGHYISDWHDGNNTVASYQSGKSLHNEDELTEQELELFEVLSKSDDTSKWIHDFVHSDNPKFEGKSKKDRIRMALGAYYSKQNEEHLGFDKLKNKLAHEKNPPSNPAAVAAAIGRKKYGVKKFAKMAHEENIQEVSQGLLSRYLNKAQPQVISGYKNASQNKTSDNKVNVDKKTVNRHRNTELAIDKITKGKAFGKSKISATEELIYEAEEDLQEGHLLYNTNPEKGGVKSKISPSEWDKERVMQSWSKHKVNHKILHHIMTHHDDFHVRQRANHEMDHAQRKMDFWERHKNFSADEARVHQQKLNKVDTRVIAKHAKAVTDKSPALHHPNPEGAKAKQSGAPEGSVGKWSSSKGGPQLRKTVKEDEEAPKKNNFKKLAQFYRVLDVAETKENELVLNEAKQPIHTATALYYDSYADKSTPAKLTQMKTSKGISHRWVNDKGHTVDGLRPGVYSHNYQMNHATKHAKFSEVKSVNEENNEFEYHVQSKTKNWQSVHYGKTTDDVLKHYEKLPLKNGKRLLNVKSGKVIHQTLPTTYEEFNLKEYDNPEPQPELLYSCYERTCAELKALANKAMHIAISLPPDMKETPWVQDKITSAAAQVSDIHDYLIYGKHSGNIGI